MELYGRRKVYTDFDVITEDNVRQAVGKAGAIHEHNASESKLPEHINFMCVLQLAKATHAR